MRGAIINYDTGEVTTEINDNDSVKVTRGASIEYLEQTQTWKIEHFYKGSAIEIRKLMQELNIYEKAFLFSVAVYIGYEDCCIKHDNGIPMGTEDIISLAGLTRSKAYEVIKSLMAKHVIYKGDDSKEKHYFVNPWLFCKGNRINKVLKTMFRNYKIRVLNGKRWGDLK